MINCDGDGGRGQKQSHDSIVPKQCWYDAIAFVFSSEMTFFLVIDSSPEKKISLVLNYIV